MASTPFSQEETTAAGPWTASTSHQNAIEASISILIQQLKSKWVSERAPKGLQKTLAETRTTHKITTTERIFLDHGGIAAWVAYFRATYGNHIVGKRFPQNILSAFQKVTVQDRISAAKRVAAVTQHPDVAKIILNASQNRRRK
jgi:hypothetical protein